MRRITILVALCALLSTVSVSNATETLAAKSACKVKSIQPFFSDATDDDSYLSAAVTVRNRSKKSQSVFLTLEVRETARKKVLGNIQILQVIPPKTTLPLPGTLYAGEIPLDSKISIKQTIFDCEPTKQRTAYAEIRWPNPSASCDSFYDEQLWGIDGCPLVVFTNKRKKPVQVEKNVIVWFDADGRVVGDDDDFAANGMQVPPSYSLDLMQDGGVLVRLPKTAVRGLAWVTLR